MNPLAALMPTHTMLASAATRSADIPVRPSVPLCLCGENAPSADPIRKYVIVRDPLGHEHPIIFARALQHSTMVPVGHTPVSAGFFIAFENTIRVLSQFDSSSLNLSPREQDQALLKSFMSVHSV